MKIKKIVSIVSLLLASLAAAQAQVSPITAWSFEAGGTKAAPYNSPPPSTGSGTATVLGMNNTYNGTTAAANADVLATAGASTGSGSYGWRIRGTPGNGWSTQAPIGTQGAEFAASTVGFNNITVAFDINTTAQAEGNLAVFYTLDGSTWQNATLTSPGSGAGAALQNNTTSSSTVTGSYVKLSATAGWNNQITASIPGAGNNPNFAITIVNASTAGDCVNISGAALNNSSGNWRYDNVIISGTVGGGTANTPPVLTADATATVDGPFTDTFTDDLAWRAAITGIKVNNTTLSPSAYTISAGKIKFTPSASTLLQTNGSKNIVISATGYNADTVIQSIAPGAAKNLFITAQPGAPTANGGTLVTNPVLTVLDQYNNAATNCTAVFTASVGAGAWSFGSGSGLAQVLANGTVVFTNLSATSAAAVSGAIITFTASSASGLGALPATTTNSAVFNIPAPAATGFTPGNLAVLQEDVAVKNSTFSILELSPVIANQSSPVNTFAISATGPNALRQASSATTGRLADSNDGSLVCFTGFEDGSSATADETTINPRGVGTLNANGAFVLQTSYTGFGGSTANQTRSATSVDDVNWFIGDKGGVYVNGGISPLIAGAGNNVRSLKSFGGTVYALQQASSSVINTPISIVQGATLYPLDGFAQDAAVLDFYMLQSGANGSTYDTVYYIDGTNTTSGAIYKYYLTGNVDPNTSQPLWALAGHVDTANGGDGLCAVTNASGGVDLYYTTGSGGIAGNSLVKVHDSAPDNTSISLSVPITLYTVAAPATLKGVAFAPVLPPAAPAVTALTVSNLTSSSALLYAVVSPNGALTTNAFFCNTNLSAPGTYYNVGSVIVPAGTSPVSVSNLLAALLPGEKYNFYVEATNSAGVYDGSSLPVSFTTLVNLGAVTLNGGNLTFGFASAPGASAALTVWGTTNLALPFNQWQNLGHPTEITSGRYQFIDVNTAALNGPQRFYKVTPTPQ
jgi:hypothetical protein